MYLVETSGEYIDFNPRQAEIDALLQEIADLRNENLELRQEFADALVSQFGDVDVEEQEVEVEPNRIASNAAVSAVAGFGGNSGDGSGGTWVSEALTLISVSSTIPCAPNTGFDVVTGFEGFEYSL